MKHLRNIRLIALKELKLFAADRMALTFALLFPFLFVVLFNFVMTGVNGDDTRLTIRLATQEASGGMSYQILSALETKDEASLQPGEPVIIWLKDYEQAKQDVVDKKITGFIAFPADFTEAVMMGYGTELEIYYNPSDMQATAALKGLAQSISSEIGAQQVVKNSIIGLTVEQSLTSPAEAAKLGDTIRAVLMGQYGGQANTSQVTFSIQKFGEIEAENPSNFVIPGYLVMFVFFAASFAAAQLVKERQNHTLERLLSGTVTRNEILGGVFAGTVARGLIQMVIFWAVGILLFKMDLGLAPAAVFLISLLMILMASAFGLMLSTFVKTERSASSIGVLTSLILAPLGGCWWPLFITPKWMQTMGKITPHGWAMEGFNKLLVFGADFKAVIPDMLVLIGFTVVFASIAIIKFRTDAE